ncbi:MAG: pentapeptide repeat-containing protein [Paracoccaceae bacterium]|jgi:uncharacterized protein YjbI with pentapeptide repeats|nr:pentapeptide repeat-containing protein [Paracoccaceae bacterium]MDG2257780.1 pentapeptide repeat-containing protein [Paracoccaceae bacterium]
MSDAQALVVDLKRPWKHGEHVDACGITLDEPLILDRLEVRGLDLSGAVLNGGISAVGTTFRGLAWMRGSKISGVCDFTGAHFRTDFRADNLEAEAVLLRDCNLQGCLSLAGSKLKSLTLQNALVMANLTLQGADIVGAVNLKEAEIMGGLWTTQARLGSLSNRHAEISGRIQLTGF